MKQKMIVILFLLVTLLAAPCAWADSVMGRVVTSDGRSVANTQIEIGDNSALTDRNGAFVMWLDPGIYRNVRVQRHDLQNEVTVRVPSGKPISIEIKVRR